MDPCFGIAYALMLHIEWLALSSFWHITMGCSGSRETKTINHAVCSFAITIQQHITLPGRSSKESESKHW